MSSQAFFITGDSTANQKSFLTAVAAVLLLTASMVGGCASSRSTVSTPPVVVSVDDLDASGDDPVYFSLARQAIVAPDEEWDVSFAGTTIGVNGGALILDRAFDRITEAPATGYRPETSDEPALPTDPDQRWFDYDPNTHVVSPVPFRTIIVRNSSQRYAKLEITDYYDGLGTPRFYSFRYAFQSADSRILGPDPKP